MLGIIVEISLSLLSKTKRKKGRRRRANTENHRGLKKEERVGREKEKEAKIQTLYSSLSVLRWMEGKEKERIA